MKTMLKIKLAGFILISQFCTADDTLDIAKNTLGEIQLASEAAPRHITDQASFMAFQQEKFTLIKQGDNNFTCLVVRNPENRFEPACFNDEAMRSVFPTYELHMALRYEGLSEQQALAEINLRFQSGQLPAAETASLVYMMSANNRAYNVETESLVAIPSHQMYFFPKIPDETFRLDAGPPWLWQGYPHLSSLIVVTEPANKVGAIPEKHSH